MSFNLGGASKQMYGLINLKPYPYSMVYSLRPKSSYLNFIPKYLTFLLLNISFSFFFNKPYSFTNTSLTLLLEGYFGLLPSVLVSVPKAKTSNSMERM